MPTRIASVFGPDRRPPRLIAYTMAGDFVDSGSLEGQARRCCAWLAAGVDILEIGVPYSDPMADGPAIQRCHQRALDRGGSAAEAIELAGLIRNDAPEAPIVIMSYLNPLLQLGEGAAIESMSRSGVDGALIVDGPGPECPELYDGLIEAGIDPIALVAPNTVEERLESLLERARGFIYALALKGVTGSPLSDTSALGGLVETLRARSALPIAAGFGIREPGQLASLPSDIDGVVVGSALAELTEKAPAMDCPEAIELIRSFAAGG